MTTTTRPVWMMPGLFLDGTETEGVEGMEPITSYSAVEVRPVRMEDDGANCVALLRGDGQKPDFWSVYLVTADGMAEAVADLHTEGAADAIAEALVTQYPTLKGAAGTLRGPVLSWEIAEAAQCLWEAVLDAVRALPGANDPAWVVRVRHDVESVGYGEVRLWMRDLALPCHVAWVWATETRGYGDSFDWEFCPSFLDSLDWSEEGRAPTVKRAPGADAVAVAAAPVAPVDIAQEMATVLEAIAIADATPDATAFAAAMRNATDLLARMGVKVEG